MRSIGLVSCFVAVLAAATAVEAANWGLKKGTPDLKVPGPLAFGPDGILLVGDVADVSLFAIDTGDAAGDPAKVTLNLQGINAKVADALNVGSGDVSINDLAVNPASGNVYLSVSKKTGDVVGAAIVRIAPTGKLSAIGLKNVPFAKIELPTQADGKRTKERARDAIADLAYTDGKVLVSGSVPNPAGGRRGLATVREVPFPFVGKDSGVQIEIFHGAHGRLETSAAVRTFVSFNIDGKPSLLAGFTCTPLVRFDLKSLKSDKPVRGTTVAELGNHNQPYDMIVYQKDDATWLLMANSARGVMKISTKDLASNKGITERIAGGGVAGQTYETISELKGVVQLAKLNDDHAIVITKNGDVQNLQTIALP